MNSYPEELLVPPQPLAAVICDAAFGEPLARTLRGCSSSNAGAAAVDVRYSHFPSGAKFPKKARAHGQDYDSYVPDGILRSNWLGKHAQLPAVLLLASPFNLRADAAQWGVEEGTLVNRVLSLREYARGRGQDILVVLVNAGPLPAGRSALGEDYQDVLSERITALRRKTGLDGQSVTVIADVDCENDRHPWLQALASSVRERALAFYQNHCRRIKAVVANRVKQPAQAGLRARLLFKMAHFQEFRGRPAKALKYLCLCANTLQAFAPVCPPHLLCEVKAVADYVNFKCVHGYLQHGLDPVVTHTGMQIPGAQAALMLFNSHLRTFEGVLGPEDRARPWSHWAWMSRQYVVAAELLQLNLPRPGPDTKAAYVPAHYYHTAALYASKRRKAAEAAGVIPSVHVAYHTDGTAGTAPAPLCASVTGLEQAKAAAVAAGDASKAPRTPAVEAAHTELARYGVADPQYVGAQPYVAPLEAPKPLPRDAAAPVLHAASMVSESAFGHGDNVMELLEKAQAIALVDGGSGSVARTLAGTSGVGLAPAEREAREKSLFYSYGSNYTYEVAPDCSRGRLWRQSLVAEEAFTSGRADAALKLLLPVAERYRCEKAWPLLAKTLQRLRDCAVVVGDAPLLAALTLELMETAQRTTIGAKVEELQAHLAAMLRAAAKGGAGAGAGKGGVPLLTMILPTPVPLTADVDDAQPSFVRAPSPARATASLRQPNAPLLSAVLAFSNRCAQRGRRVRVRLILTSALPRALLAEEVHVTFSHAYGDFPLRVEGQGSDLARPLMSGMHQLAGASPFDVVLRHGPAPAGADLDDGVLVLPASATAGIGGKGASSSSGPAKATVITLPLILPARGSIAVEYDVELPGLGTSGEDSGTASAAQADVPAVVQAVLGGAGAAGADAVAEGGGMAAAAAAAATNAARFDSCCTDPVTMVTALSNAPVVPPASAGAGAGRGGREAPHVNSAWDSRSETILPQRILVCWAGRASEGEAAGAVLQFDVLPRPFTASSAGGGRAQPGSGSGMELRPISPGLHLKPLESLLACLAQHRLPAAMALADSIQPSVAHMVRTGVGLGSARGIVGAFAPGTGGPGFADGDISAPDAALATGRAVADASTVQEARAAGKAFLSAPGAAIHAASAPSAAQADGLSPSAAGWDYPPAFLSHETDGAACGKPPPYHPVLLVLAPDAHITITTASGWEGSSGSGAAATAPAIVAGVPSPIRLTVSCGRRGILGGLLKFSGWAAPAGSGGLRRGSSTAGGMADVSLAGTPTAASAAAAAGGASSGAPSSSGSRLSAGASSVADAAAASGPQPTTFLVHGDTHVVLKDGRQVPASSVGSAGGAAASTAAISAAHGLVAISTDTVAGIALPALPAGVAFSFQLYALVPLMPPSPTAPGAGAGGAGVADGVAPCADVSIACDAHVTEEDGMGNGSLSPTTSGDKAATAGGAKGGWPAWLSTLASTATLHRTLSSEFLLPAYPPLTTRVTVIPDPAAPLLDLSPILLPPHGPQRPFQGMPAGWDRPSAAVASAHEALASAVEEAVFSMIHTKGAVGHVRAGTRFNVVLDVVCNPIAHIAVRDIAVGAGAGAATGSGLTLVTALDDIRRQAGLGAIQAPAAGAASASAAAGGAIGLSAAIAKALASSSSGAAAGTAGVLLEPGRSITATLAFDATSEGLHALGAVKLSWALGQPASQQKAGAVAPKASTASSTLAPVVLPLPPVAVHSPSIRCNVSFPAAPKAGERCTLSLQLTNASAHFHAVEVMATQPAALPPQGMAALAAAVAAGGVRPGMAPGSSRSTASGSNPFPMSPQQGQGQGPFGSGGASAAGAGAGASTAVSIPPGMLPVPAMELTGYARFIVELLPGQAKSVNFNLLPHTDGYVALPIVSVKPSTGSKVPGGPAPALAAAAAAAAGFGAAPLLDNTRRVSAGGDLLLTLASSGPGSVAGRRRGSTSGRPAGGAGGLAAAGGAGATPFGAPQPMLAPPVPLTVYVQ